MSKRDNDRVTAFWRCDVTRNATFIAEIRQARDNLTSVIGRTDLFSLKLLHREWCQIDFEWCGLFQRCKQPSGRLQIVEHQRHSSLARDSEQMVMDSRE